MKQPNTVRHICGQCGESFSDEATYLKHRCPVSGEIPKTPERVSSTIYRASSPLEKKILSAVQLARQEKRDDHA